MITSQERGEVRECIKNCIREIERLVQKNPPTNDAEMTTGVSLWEQKIYSQYANQPEEYRRKTQAKKQRYLDDIKKYPQPSRPRLEELRKTLEECRSVLRLIYVFGLKKYGVIELRDEFVTIFQLVTDTIKEYKLKHVDDNDMEVIVTRLLNSSRTLLGKLTSKLKQVQDLVNVEDSKILFAMESIPLGLMERFLEVQGNKSLTKIRTETSIVFGGKAVFSQI